METLRRVRTMRGMNQVDLAEASGVAQNTISEIELGKRVPRPATLKKLADALGVEIVDFFGEHEAPKVVGGSSPQPSFNDVLAEERPGRRPWRSQAEAFIRQNEGLLSDPELTYVVSSKLLRRSVDRLMEVNEAIRAADRDEDFPLTERNEMQRAFDRYQAFCTKAFADHDRRFERREVTDEEAEEARKRMRRIDSDRGVA